MLKKLAEPALSGATEGRAAAAKKLLSKFGNFRTRPSGVQNRFSHSLFDLTTPSPSFGSVYVLTDLDQTTIANMTAALDAICKKIPPEKDCHELRKRIADAMIALAGERKRTFVDFQSAGLEILDDVIRPGKRKWRGLFRGLGSSSAS